MKLAYFYSFKNIKKMIWPYVKQFSMQVILMSLCVLSMTLNTACQQSAVPTETEPIEPLNIVPPVQLPPLQITDTLSDSVDTANPVETDDTAGVIEEQQESTSFLLENYDDRLPHNTSEIFLFAEGLMELGRISRATDFDNVEQPNFLTALGHKVITSFYDESDNYMSYGPRRTPYIQAALFITEMQQDELLLTKFKEQTEPRITDIQNVVSQMPLNPLRPLEENRVHALSHLQFLNEMPFPILMGNIEDYSLSYYFDEIRDRFLRNIHDEIREQIPDISETLVESVRATIEEEYIDLLYGLENDLQRALDEVRVRLRNSPLFQIDQQVGPSVIPPSSIDEILTPLETVYNDFLDAFLTGYQNQVLQDFKNVVEREIANGYIALNSDLAKNTARFLIIDFPRLKNQLDTASNEELIEELTRITREYGMEAQLINWARRYGITDAFTRVELELSLPRTWFPAFRSQVISSFVPDPEQILSYIIDYIRPHLRNVAVYVDDLIYTIILMRHADALNSFLPQIPEMVGNVLAATLEERIQPVNVYDAVHDIAEEKAQEIAFQGRDWLPGIELSNVAMKNDGSIIFFEREGDALITNGTTLGTAMSVLTERFKGINTFEDNFEDENKTNQLLFSLFNKSVRLIGIDTFVKSDQDFYIHHAPTTFFRPIWREQHQTQQDNLIINDYNNTEGEDSEVDLAPEYCPLEESMDEQSTQDGYFAIPDRLVLQDDLTPFDIDLEQTHRQPMVSTVIAQAELIRGASKVLRYLRPDQITSFLLDMGNIDYEGEAIFPPASLFNLHLAIVAVNLINLRRRGITIYDQDMNPTFIHTMTDSDMPDGTLYASIQDVMEGDESFPYISTIDLARFLIALDELISIAENLSLEGLPAEESYCDTRKYIAQIKDNVDLLNTLSMGLGFLMVGQMQRQDGSFASQYDVHGRTLTDQPASLEVQVQAMQALIRLYKRSGGFNLKGAVIKSFNYSSNKLFNPDLGFYVNFEGSDQQPSLRLTTDLLHTLYQIEPLIEEDAPQKARQLRQIRQHLISDFIQDLTPLDTAL